MTGALPNGKAISRLGLGCSSVWAQAAFPEKKAREIVEAALAAGINHFDTGASYGWGRAETRLGQFLNVYGPENVVVSTKAGTFKDGKNFTPARLEASLTESLARLGVSHVDILYLHGARRRNLNDGVLRFFEREKARGRITYAGLNTFARDGVLAFMESPLDVVMLQYNVADVSAQDLFAPIVAKGKTIMAGTILAQGVTSLATVMPTSWPRLWYLARVLGKDRRFFAKGRRLAPILARHELTRPEDMARFALADPHVLSGLFGTSSIDHVARNAQAAAHPLDAEAYARLLLDLKTSG